MTIAEFLAWEERQPLRYEFDGVRAVAVTGGTLRHNRICRNLNAALDARLRGGPCQAFGTDVKIVANDHIRYPDALVTCSPQNEIGTIAEAPVVVFEVVSTSTESVDRVEKLRDYLAVPTIAHYVIVAQHAKAAAIYTRDGDRWVAQGAREGEAIDLPALSISIPIDDLYEGVETLTPQDEDDHPRPG